MKRHFIFIMMVFCMGSQSNLSICAEKKQSWSEWFKEKLFPKMPDVDFMEKYHPKDMGSVYTYTPNFEPALYTGLAGSVVYVADKGVSADDLIIHGLGALGLMVIIRAIVRAFRHESAREKVVSLVKNTLALAIGNPLHYPTRSSKINALLKKDEFLQYVNVYVHDTEGYLDEACARLSKEISKMDYSDAQKEEDKVIDAYMATLRGLIINKGDIEEQIKTLELIQDKQDSIIKMRAYLSLYYRLKNKLEVENGLTSEQKKSLNKWKEEAVSLAEESKKKLISKMKSQELERLVKEKERSFVEPAPAQ